ncbi:MAG: hypothetical protein JWO58_2960 [Chitinophagaceae bacterium]|nr:hypothetical protein [Chitinophagaceae bacterium]
MKIFLRFFLNFIQLCVILIITIGLCYTSVCFFKEQKNLIISGPIGDTIGGLTAPIINLVSVILI